MSNETTTEGRDAAEEAFVASVVPKIRRLQSGRGRIIDAATQAMGGAGLVGSWVSVERRLPEWGTYVLVWTDEGSEVALRMSEDEPIFRKGPRGKSLVVKFWARIREPKT